MRWALMFSLSIGGPPQVRQSDAWIGVDKWKHFAVCSVVQSVGYGVALGGQGHAASLRIGAAAVAAVGVGREVYDWRVKGHFSAKDLAWDALGASSAALVLHTVR